MILHELYNNFCVIAEQFYEYCVKRPSFETYAEQNLDD